MKRALSIVLLMGVMFGVSEVSRAAMPRELYLKSLQAAEKYVQRTKVAGAGALTASNARMLMGRPYEVGDKWEVAALHINSSIARMTDDEHHKNDRPDRVAFFRYEVASLYSDGERETSITVTQAARPGFPLVDSAVSSMILGVNDRLAQVRKDFVMVRGGAALSASTGGLMASVSLLEFFPLDLPDMSQVEPVKARALPVLPAPLAAVAEKLGFKPDLSRTFEIEDQDFFGRPVEVFWQQGDPWPSVIKTQQGVSILVPRGR
jgi:hypothetical protein